MDIWSCRKCSFKKLKKLTQCNQNERFVKKKNYVTRANADWQLNWLRRTNASKLGCQIKSWNYLSYKTTSFYHLFTSLHREKTVEQHHVLLLLDYGCIWLSGTEKLSAEPHFFNENLLNFEKLNSAARVCRNKSSFSVSTFIILCICLIPYLICWTSVIISLSFFYIGFFNFRFFIFAAGSSLSSVSVSNISSLSSESSTHLWMGSANMLVVVLDSI